MAVIVKGKNRNKPYTVRYLHEGKQRERSYKTQAEAKDFIAKWEHDRREHIFVDPALANEPFRRAAEGWLDRHTGSPRTLAAYASMLRIHINPAMGSRRLRDVAADREGLQVFLLKTMPANGQGPSQVRQAYMIVNAIVNDAVRSGKLGKSMLRGIQLPVQPQTKANEFVFPTQKQVLDLAFFMDQHGFGAAVWLMRGCGLRVSEVLGVRWSDFLEDSTVLRVQRQLAIDGTMVPLKHRNDGDFRDVPVPEYVRSRLPAFREGEPPFTPFRALFPAVTRRQFSDWFWDSRVKAGIARGFTPHSLRHVFASVCLANGVPITDVSRWLGHASIQTTFSIYSHFVPSSFGRARDVLDREWSYE